MFELSPHIDKNKIFLINFSKLQDRYDPAFYSINLNLENFIKVKKIGKVQGGKRLPKGYYYSEIETDYIYLRVSDLSSENDIDWNNVKYISKEVYKILKRYQVFEGDLVFSIAGTVGKIKIIKNIPEGKKVILTENAAKIKIKDNNYLSETLEIVLKSKILQTQIDLNYIQTTIPKIGLDRIENLFIPYFDLPTQQQIIELYETAYKIKQQKEAEAEQLLNSIDDYLLGELGITLPEKDNSLENRIFKVNFSELTGGRFAPDYYKTYYKNLNKSILNSKYPISKIKDVISFIGSGKTPASTDYSDKPTEYPIIKAGSYTDEFIDLNKVDYTTIKPAIYVKKGDIFILSAAHQAEYVGKQIKYLNDIPKQKTSFVGELICVRANPLNVNSIYLFSLLNLNIYKTLLNREKTGQTSHIYAKDIKNIFIPIPQIDKQNEIAEHIKEIREQAKQLKQKAKEVLEQAKQEVEKMILGE